MIDTSVAREQILAKIRGSSTAGANPASEAYSHLPRAYVRSGSLDLEHRLEMLEDRLHEYDASVRRVTATGVSRAIAETLSSRGKNRIAIAAGLPPEWLPAGFTFIEADKFSGPDLDRLDGFLSSCALAIALTGTIVLQNAPGQGPRKLSLVPDYHLCVVLASQVVETVSEAFDRLAATSALPATFISGPSATADIEMTRIKGVHGPRVLDVLIVT